MKSRPRRRRTLPAWLLLAAFLAAFLALGWVVGFVWFVRDSFAARVDPAILRSADAIVVLTGGADRIVTGVHLLQQGDGHALLISGVGHGADLADLLRGSFIDARALAGQITLGRSATKTIGNADEAADWAAQLHVHALIVVTAVTTCVAP